MTTSSMSSSPSGFHVEPNQDHDPQHQQHQFFATNYHVASSSYSYQFNFNSTGYYPSELYQPQQQLDGNNYDGSYEVDKRKDDNGLKLSPGTKEGKNGYQAQKDPVKKMKNPADRSSDELLNNTNIKLEDQKQQQSSSSSMETNCSSNSPNNNTTPVRVCADCSATKTPLWRSGPEGPKSLCNACGIRQRKARRALAAAAAAANGTSFATETPTVKIKVPHKEKTKNNPQTVPFKKRCKAAKIDGGTSQGPKKLGGFEDFLINLRKNLSFHSMFPQDEKEAAILLMALSCGLVHG